ncbi:hypothetical protein Dimus_014098 [Dionaea muscipula]
MEGKTGRASSLRWEILRQALQNRRPADERSRTSIDRISRRTKRGFNLIPFDLASDVEIQSLSIADSTSNRIRMDGTGDVCLRYTLPVDGAPKLFVFQRVDSADLNDFEICNKHHVDFTGLVCQWPSEDVLAYYCLLHSNMFRSKRVIELGSGYGLAGLVIATVTEASEVVISDGNPQVVDYIQQNVAANAGAFGNTTVKPMVLHWDQEEISTISYTFDIVIASDCTFFQEFHKGLARTLNLLLKSSGPSEAIFFNPRRGDSLDNFLEAIKGNGLRFSLSEKYDSDVWNHHQEFMNGDESWANYEKDHCYPLLLRIIRSLMVGIRCKTLMVHSSNFLLPPILYSCAHWNEPCYSAGEVVGGGGC